MDRDIYIYCTDLKQPLFIFYKQFLSLLSSNINSSSLANREPIFILQKKKTNTTHDYYSNNKTVLALVVFPQHKTNEKLIFENTYKYSYCLGK